MNLFDVAVVVSPFVVSTLYTVEKQTDDTQGMDYYFHSKFHTTWDLDAVLVLPLRYV